MSMSNLSIDGEFRYIIQWFNEWSELQRDDFVYVFVEYLARGSSSGASDGQVNGLVNSLANAAVQDKPMSLFQCRIKLFREWSPKWPIEFKCKLQEKISEIDAKVGEKIINELRGPHSVHNGDVAVHLNANGASEEGGDSELEQMPESEVTEVATWRRGKKLIQLPKQMTIAWRRS
uniref:RH33661p n=1 Tax=Drosophila melanogaster TaxID=7227 RepID=Q6NL99_DROME|nr:RH33661p [Drosophila melanogaster]